MNDISQRNEIIPASFKLSKKQYLSSLKLGTTASDFIDRILLYNSEMNVHERNQSIHKKNFDSFRHIYIFSI
jgi:hypothetical protein